ncbi:MAG: hypothetical protein MZU84_03160 [Sphingobacterium sp.]|nr:hypothetical protein [Sphingobacterium sp.]
MADGRIGHIGERRDLLIRQGADFGPITETLTNPDGSPVDLTGCICRGQIRRTPASAEVVAEFVFEIAADPKTGVVAWGLPNAVTVALTAGDTIREAASQYAYDMEIEDASGRVLPWRYGTAFVHREVTR